MIKKKFYGYNIEVYVCTECSDERRRKYDMKHPEIADKNGLIKKEFINERSDFIWGEKFKENVISFDFGRDTIYLCARHLRKALEILEKENVKK